MPFSVSLGPVFTFVAGGAFGAVIHRFRDARWSTAATPDSAPGTRQRTGRLPLPRRVAELTPADEPALADVNVFVDRLAELPFEGWVDIAQNLMRDRSTWGRRAAASAILDASIGADGLGIAAWYVRDAVETSAFLASRSVRCWTRSERRIFAAAHAAAEDAALALLARDGLATEDFSLIVGPFAELVLATA